MTSDTDTLERVAWLPLIRQHYDTVRLIFLNSGDQHTVPLNSVGAR